MSNKQQKILNVIRVAALILLVGVIVYVAVELKENPELASAEGIAKLVSSNRFLAALEFVGLYLLKGISLIFPSAAINVAAGVVFAFPVSVLVSALGIFVEFLVLYLFGRFFGNDLVARMKQKYTAVGKIDSFQSHNSFFISFIVRIMGIVSYDVASIYLGASGVPIGGFLLGSMCGAMLNIVIDAVFGKYIFDPFHWQLWAVVGIRIGAIVLAVVVRKRGERREENL